MKIVIVGSYPPSKIGLNEYANHLIQALLLDPTVEVTVLADKAEEAPRVTQPAKNVRVIRVWQYNDIRNFWRVLTAIREMQPDIVNFQMLFTTFGDRKVPAALGLLIPTLVRLAGFKVVVTLHHLLEFIETKSTVVKGSRWAKVALELATHALIRSADIVVLQKRYADVLTSKYGGKRIHVIRHGYYTYEGKPRTYLAGHKILIFGKFGSYKRLEFPIEVYEKVKKLIPAASLTICGTSHPSFPNYLKEVKEKYKHIPGITFTGYVSENDLPAVFASADMMLLGYESCTGVASAELFACRFGLPIVSQAVEELSAQHVEEGIQVVSFSKFDRDTAADVVFLLFSDRNYMQFISDSNFARALTMPMSEVGRLYIELFTDLISGRK